MIRSELKVRRACSRAFRTLPSTPQIPEFILQKVQNLSVNQQLCNELFEKGGASPVSLLKKANTALKSFDFQTSKSLSEELLEVSWES